MAFSTLQERFLNRAVIRHTIFFALGILALVLIACGSDPAPVPTPVPTATSTATLPTATPEPPPTPTTVPPSPTTATTTQAIIPTAVPEVALLDAEVERLGQAAMETLTYLTNDLSPRASGTEEEELVAAEYLRDEFAATGVRSVDSALRGAVDLAVRAAVDGRRTARR